MKREKHTKHTTPPIILVKGEEHLKDITAPEMLQIVIREDSKVVWINTERCCVFRACQIKKLVIDDRRESLDDIVR